MFLIFVSVVLSVGLFVLLGMKKKERWGYEFKRNKTQRLAVIPLLLILFNFIAIVPANHVGILYSPFRGVKNDTIAEGWSKKGIFDKVYKISTEVQTVNLSGITGQTKDGQWVDMIIDVKYKVDESTAFQVFKQYRNLDKVATSLIPPTVQRSIEEISTQYNVIDILGEKRNELYKGIEVELKERLSANGITFISINFTDTDAGEAIEQAIQQEAIAKKAVETAEQERQKAQIEAQRRVVEAEANKQKATIEAETKLIEAKAEADANNLLLQSITPELLKKMEMEARLRHGWITVNGGNVITDVRNGE